MTGASDGIGRSLAIKCAGICKTLTLVARNSSGKLDALKSELNSSSTEVNIHSMDLNDYSQAESLISSIYKYW
ncbi:SDR family NAD(P)-dependent oxidoreductase [Okeania sp. SIO2B3]|uniref:SDR family NAD(P)-dependent oxidoreductase n=1 Tax=Okeania sp. SIO2B3 TaxID=2607784 RepID=UPI0013BF6596|nr:SDR family NAD(P)-dependent oxidoreductase [Okeania sp. SIO2B3]